MKRNFKRFVLIAALLLIFYFLTGFFISTVLILLIVFKKDFRQIIQLTFNLEKEKVFDILSNKKSDFKSWFVGIILFFVIFNITFYIFHLPYQGRKEKTETYNIFYTSVDINAKTWSMMHGDKGPAIVYIKTDGPAGYSLREIETSFDFDSFLNFGPNPVRIRYCFYNLDLIPDLVIETSDNNYFISGLTGEIHSKNNIIDRLRR